MKSISEVCAKLVINSHIGYGKALRHAFRSLFLSGFDEWEDVVVVFGGCKEEDEHGPKYEKVVDGLECIVIKTKEDSFDYHGYNMLHKYKNHDLIKSDLYIYTLDTVEFLPNFPQIFSGLTFYNPRYDIFTCRLPNSNVVAFNDDVIDMYGDMYSFDEGRYMISKHEAVRIEHGGHKVNGVYIRNLAKLNRGALRAPRVKWLREGNGVYSNKFDPYRVGKKRGFKLLPELGIKKYIRWDSCFPEISSDLIEDGRHHPRVHGIGEMNPTSHKAPPANLSRVKPSGVWDKYI